MNGKKMRSTHVNTQHKGKKKKENEYKGKQNNDLRQKKFKCTRGMHLKLFMIKG
jgi:hypothetical protein